MKITGKYTETLKTKAINEAMEIITAMYKGDSKELWNKTQLSWRYNRKIFNLFGFKIRYRSYKNHKKHLFIPDFNGDKKYWEITMIHFHSPIMIDVYAVLGDSHVYRIRMIAEKKPYVTNPEAPFRYNPNSLRLATSQC